MENSLVIRDCSIGDNSVSYNIIYIDRHPNSTPDMDLTIIGPYPEILIG